MYDMSRFVILEYSVSSQVATYMTAILTSGLGMIVRIKAEKDLALALTLDETERQLREVLKAHNMDLRQLFDALAVPSVKSDT